MSKSKLQQACKKRYLEILDEEYIMSTNSNSLQGLVYWDEYIEFNRRATAQRISKAGSARRNQPVFSQGSTD